MPRIQITDVIRQELIAQHKRTNVGPQRLLKGKSDRPKGLTSAHIYNWLTGDSKTTDDVFLNWVLKEWRNEDILVQITPEMCSDLCAQFDRTGISPKMFLNKFPNAPEELLPDVISRLKRGKRRTINQNSWGFLIQALHSLPDKEEAKKRPYIGRNDPACDVIPTPPKNKVLKILADDLYPLSETNIAQLKAQRKRTGVGATGLLRIFAAEKPDKLSSSTISSWITGHAERASKSRIIWVLENWKSLPDKPKK